MAEAPRKLVTVSENVCVPALRFAAEMPSRLMAVLDDCWLMAVARVLVVLPLV